MYHKYNFFEYKEDEWVFDEKLIEYSEKVWGSPFYLFDLEKAKKNVKEIRNGLGDNVQIAYAMKANPWIAECLSNESDYIEVCSEGELDICINRGIKGEKIVLDGVLKKESILKKAIAIKVKRIAIESKKQLENLSALLDINDKMEILLRVSSGNQFGMDEKEVEECIKYCRYKENIKIIGIQYYPGTQRRDIKKIQRDLEKLDAWIAFFEKILMLKLCVIEFGAGIGNPYFENEDKESFVESFEYVAKYVSKLLKSYKVVYECGRNIASTCGVYVTKIFSEKKIGEKRILFCEGGSNHLKYHGGILGVRNPKICTVGKKNYKRKEKCMVCGCLCSESDILIQETMEIDTGITVGDYLIFLNAGGYAAAEASNFFLTMEMPAILLYNEKDNKVEMNIKGVRRCTSTFELLYDKV